ncbi:MAG: hypothetical protein JO033_18470 [Acidobacteriaceae bacterium]|nr:hypothetical protein [Acidobacteriaceae bacterium]
MRHVCFSASHSAASRSQVLSRCLRVHRRLGCNDLQHLLKSKSSYFTFAKTADATVDVRDFQTTGVVAFARGCPFSKLEVGKQTIGVKEEYRQNALKAINVLAGKL